MRRGLAYLTGSMFLLLFFGCSDDTTKPEPAVHVAGADCAGCHVTEQSEWSSPMNLHAASTVEVLGNVEHNTEEILNDDCLKCHSAFQVPLGVGHFVTPVDQVGSPPGTWTVQNTADWEATKCEVCHDPSATNDKRLAKYGAFLDEEWSPGYTHVSDLPNAYQEIIDLETGATSTFVYPDQTTLSVQATKLCSSCHDPADQGEEPAVIEDGIDLGPQGGDSRSYVASNHKGFGCIDCHNSHTFRPANPATTSPCVACHTGTPKTGKVHINHWE